MAGTAMELKIEELGKGRPVLVLHGGGGPATVVGLAAHLAERNHVLLPTHPGWNGIARPDWLDSIDDLAMLYLRELQRRHLAEVLVVGSSIGGWLGTEMAWRDLGGLIAGLVIVDGTGALIPSEPSPDFFSLTPRGVAEHAYHNPDRFFVDPATLSAEQLAMMQANRATLKLIAGGPRAHDPKLLRRAGDVTIPVLAVWGDSDRIVTPGYGRAFAAAFPNARFELIAHAGHLPQIERPEATFAVVDGFVEALAR
jgi:pimeloyl-ACP methyl ester carboxylesterase